MQNSFYERDGLKGRYDLDVAVKDDDVNDDINPNYVHNLNFAVENAYLPFNYVDPADGEAKGWDYDVFNHMAELMNFTPVYVLSLIHI